MNLSIKERLVLLNILPGQETYANMLVIKNLRDEVGFSEEDHQYLGITENDGDVSWDPDKQADKEVSIGVTAYGIIKKAFKKLDSDQMVSIELMDVYERFTQDEPEVGSLNGVTEIASVRT